ncbi:hypothetical protein BRD22_05595 [Halobacteriales archaeon SW_8_68_21]|nr:MAG: hypothetical protein BRD22_05595 [Halobacteriales archaeon SW_8_68_21]
MDRDSETGGDEDPTGRNGVDDGAPGGRIDRRTVLGAVTGAGSAAVAEAAAASDNGERTDRQLANVLDRIARIEERLAAAREGLPPGLANATGKRVAQATRRVEQARNAGKL